MKDLHNPKTEFTICGDIILSQQNLPEKKATILITNATSF